MNIEVMGAWRWVRAMTAPGLLLSLQTFSAWAEPVRAEVIQIDPEAGKAWKNGETISIQDRDSVRFVRGDVLTTGRDTWVELLFLPQVRVQVGPLSEDVVDVFEPDSPPGETLFRLMRGVIRVTVGHLGLAYQKFVVDAVGVQAAPMGTDFLMNRDAAGAVQVAVLEGWVEVWNEAGERVEVPAGSQVRADANGRLGPVEAIPPGESPSMGGPTDYAPLIPGLPTGPDDVQDGGATSATTRSVVGEGGASSSSSAAPTAATPTAATPTAAARTAEVPTAAAPTEAKAVVASDDPSASVPVISDEATAEKPEAEVLSPVTEKTLDWETGDDWDEEDPAEYWAQEPGTTMQGAPGTTGTTVVLSPPTL